MAVVALVVGKAEPLVGFDRVEPAVLQRVSADLVGETDAASLLAKIEQHAAAGLADDVERFAKLRPAIAFERAEHVAGQAFAVQADQRRLAAERADHQRDMLLPVVGGAEGDDLRRRHVVERKPGAGDDFDRRLRSFANDIVDRDDASRDLRVEQP